MIHNQTSLPRLFKGIALFTPGGDLIYGIDTSKQAHWHIHLCISLQQILGLSEPPHFLVPGYTATVDRWFDQRNQQITTSAEIYPAVKRYQPLLRVLFETEEVVWQTASWQEEYCNPMMLETYRHQFPQLWEDHNLIIRLDPSNQYPRSNTPKIETAGYFAQLSISSEQQNLPANISLNSQIKRRNQEENEENTRNLSVYPQEIEANPANGPSLPSENNVSVQNEISNSMQFSSSLKQNNSGYVLRLFVSSDNAAVEKTLIKIHQLLEEGLTYPYTLKVIDISKNPEQAEINHISATPTLLRVWPKPVRRIVGKLDDFERVLQIISSL